MIPSADPGLRFVERRDAIEQAIARVFDRRRFIGNVEVAGFELEFAQYIGTSHAVGVASGTQALALALSALGVGRGDEVITVAMTAPATAVAIECAGAIPIFVDIDPRTRCMDPDALAAAITPATAAVVPVHLHGFAAPMPQICEIAERNGLTVVEDCAQSHGATIGGRRTGTFGHAAAFSFYPTKNLGAAGDAGAVVTSDAAIAARVKRLRNYGMDESGQCVERGTNERLDEIQAAILRVLLPDLDRQNARRRVLAAEYRSCLADAALELPAADEEAVYHQFAIALENRDQVRRRLDAVHGIGTGIHFSLGAHHHPHFARAGAALPVTERLARSFLSLPIQPEVAEGRVKRIADALLESINACRS